MGIRCAVL